MALLKSLTWPSIAVMALTIPLLSGGAMVQAAMAASIKVYDFTSATSAPTACDLAVIGRAVPPECLQQGIKELAEAEKSAKAGPVGEAANANVTCLNLNNPECKAIDPSKLANVRRVNGIMRNQPPQNPLPQQAKIVVQPATAEDSAAASHEGGVMAAPKVEFALNSAELTNASRKSLDEVAKVIKWRVNQGLIWEIEGHTDATGTPAHNDRLSLRRAEAVIRYLHEKGGVALERLRPVAMGQRAPLYPDRPFDGANRRVQIGHLGT